MKKFCLVLAVLMCSGCAHSGAQQGAQAPATAQQKLTVANAQASIVKGKTTQREVTEKIGVPNSKISRPVGVATGPAETWTYWTAPPLQAIGKGGTFPFFKLVVQFNDQGVVQEYQAADSTMTVR